MDYDTTKGTVKVLHKCAAQGRRGLQTRPEAWRGKLLGVIAGAILALNPVGASGKMPSASPDTSRGVPQEATPQSQATPTSTVEQTLAKRPQVTYEDGQLTISAQNSSLSEVLSALRTLMGTEIDIPATAAGQRIWVQLGPGPARRVLRDLLDGTEFNYVIQASDSDEDGIRSVLLTPKSKAGDSVTGGPAGAAGLPRGVLRGVPRDNQPAVEAPEQETPVPSAPPAAPDTAAAPPTASTALPQAASSNLQQVPGTTGVPGGGGTPVATTAEQMIQQLQSMYQQRRQIQQQQNGKSPVSNP